MEEINAWGAYEAGTTQNARSLGRTTIRKRVHSLSKDRIPRQPTAGASDDQGSEGVLEEGAAAAGRLKLPGRHESAHALFFGTDDIATLKKNTDKEDIPKDTEETEPTDVEEAAAQQQTNKEFKELYNLAHHAFEVYFADSSTDSQQMAAREVADSKKKKRRPFYTKINGTMPYTTAWLQKNLSSLPLPFFANGTILFIEASLRGIAQVYFQNNPLSGLLILAGMFVQSTRVAVHGILGITAGNLAGQLMGFDKSFLSCGLFGYNSFLVGLALATFYSPEKHGGYYWPVAVGAVIFAYFSSVLFVMLGKILSPYKTPPFTLPFNISTILFLLAMGGMNNVEMAPVRDPDLPSYESEHVSGLSARAFFAGSIRGVGQVFLANDIISGVLVLVGIMVCSRISAFAAFLGSAIGAAVAALVGCNRDAIENGMYGFNPSLTLTSMLMFYVPSIGSISIGIVASIITVFIQLALATSLEPCGLPFMTLPFCLAALAFIVIQGTTSNVISVPLSSMTTPEDHLARVSKLANGFELLYGAIRSSSYKGAGRRLTWLPQYKKSNTQRMNNVLSEYNASVHGEDKTGIFARISEWFKERKDSHGGSSMWVSTRMSVALKNISYGDEEKDSYHRMFTHIDVEHKYEITKTQFELFLKSVGLTDRIGLGFACEAFQLMDLDGNGDVDFDEFFAFVQISKLMPEIRKTIVKFFDFVDVNGDHAVEISELDAARAYLGLPALSDEDHDSLVAICNEEDELEFDVIVNFVTIFKLKTMVKEYQKNREKGFSLDDSLMSVSRHSR
mmetsp:Transcript_8223/g.14306  ORF Transcript_8223/g.14306 Transcript_8223/m.14306 type:complete len:790 (+) Transcript_8223:14-2383(+)|eukprot:CAMPEP_0183766788 /NCGR_PEP_ID=MMETSP0739-20130205/11780_1 /TAXON_ID=385413 /ORGANISM="Thalassiosira miniscula, Strain CCMP1093" /LENGTH=789 /DNA_ID=CAMNT_0026005615 /DNA_START=12 /DNA_END=2381 /DNA_ORIENTATION=+